MSKTFKDRSYTVTVNPGHLVPGGGGPTLEEFTSELASDMVIAPGPGSAPSREEMGEPTPPSILRAARHTFFLIGQLQDTGIIDYACISAEVSKAGLPHLQGFVVFNESAFGTKEKPKLPSDYFVGHWLKARSLSGARDYCAREGIHIGKEGVHVRIEYGHWVDPGWNQSLRSRLIYEFAHRIKTGATTGEIAKSNPEGVLLVGLSNLEGVVSNLTKGQERWTPAIHRRPYYYIGRTNLAEMLDSRQFRLWASHLSDEEE